jgi:hypothetical protein
MKGIMKGIPGVVIILVYLFYLSLCVHNLSGDTDPVLIGLDILCGATCLGGIALFVALILKGIPSPLARYYATGSPQTASASR